MSKITNDDLTRSGTGCFIAVPLWQQWASKGFVWLAPHYNAVALRSASSQHADDNIDTRHRTVQPHPAIERRARPISYSAGTRAAAVRRPRTRSCSEWCCELRWVSLGHDTATAPSLS